MCGRSAAPPYGLRAHGHRWPVGGRGRHEGLSGTRTRVWWMENVCDFPDEMR